MMPLLGTRGAASAGGFGLFRVLGQPLVGGTIIRITYTDASGTKRSNINALVKLKTQSGFVAFTTLQEQPSGDRRYATFGITDDFLSVSTTLRTFSGPVGLIWGFYQNTATQTAIAGGSEGVWGGVLGAIDSAFSPATGIFAQNAVSVTSGLPQPQFTMCKSPSGNMNGYSGGSAVALDSSGHTTRFQSIGYSNDSSAGAEFRYFTPDSTNLNNNVYQTSVPAFRFWNPATSSYLTFNQTGTGNIGNGPGKCTSANASTYFSLAFIYGSAASYRYSFQTMGLTATISSTWRFDNSLGEYIFRQNGSPLQYFYQSPIRFTSDRTVFTYARNYVNSYTKPGIIITNSPGPTPTSIISQKYYTWAGMASVDYNPGQPLVDPDDSCVYFGINAGGESGKPSYLFKVSDSGTLIYCVKFTLTKNGSALNYFNVFPLLITSTSVVLAFDGDDGTVGYSANLKIDKTKQPYLVNQDLTSFYNVGATILLNIESFTASVVETSTSYSIISDTAANLSTAAPYNTFNILVNQKNLTSSNVSAVIP